MPFLPVFHTFSSPNGVNINAISQEGKTVLHEAWENEDEALIAQLIDKGANINIKHAIYETTLLHWAAGEGLMHLAGLLIEKGVDVNTADISGETPLQAAIRNDQQEIMNLLRKNGAQ